MEDARILLALADALSAAQEVLRRRADQAVQPPRTESAEVVELVRREHPLLGPRQAEVLSLLAQGPSDGLSTGDLGREMSYDQPNVYLTLQELVRRGFVEKDAGMNPHRYRLANYLAGSLASGS